MDMQRCTKCHENKPITDYYKSKDSKSGHQSRCKVCQLSYSREWQKNNPERTREINLRYTRKNASARSESQRQAYYRDHTKRKAAVRDYYVRLKLKTFAAYGGRCNCCGESEPLFLCIDHINGDGNKHRREINRTNIYGWIERHGYPDDFQLLCFNCNQGKRLNGNVCPHKAIHGIEIFETGA